MPSRSRRLRRVIPVVAGMLIVSVVVAGIVLLQQVPLGRQKTGSSIATVAGQLERPLPPPNDYVGGDACRRCHHSIWESYQSHPMARSAAKIGDERPIEDFERNPSFEVKTPVGVISYRVDSTSEGQFHHESLTVPLHGQIYDQRIKVDFAVGTGQEGRSYLLVENDSLYVSPMTWYSQGAKWDLTPAYAPGNNARFERKITLACIMCHSDGVEIDREEPNRISVSSIRGLSISCERCHGPGEGHIAFHDPQSNSASRELPNDPIVNPTNLDHERQESVCWQCHYAAEERVVRYGRIDSDFRPGMSFDEIWVPFVRVGRFDRDVPAQPVNHVEQIRASTCFQRSDGRFGCLSCHDPHFAPPRDEAASFYRAKCLACHSERDCAAPIEERMDASESDSCVACHMAKRQIDRLPHTSQTDHRIRRSPHSNSPEPREIEVTILDYRSRPLPQIEQDRAWGIYLSKEAERKQDIRLARNSEQFLSSVLSHVLDDREVLERLGYCESLTGRPDSARAHFLEILERHPQDERALGQLAELSFASNDLPAARDALIRYLSINPWHSKFQVRLAAVHVRMRDLESAIQCANAALRVNPSFAPAHRILAEVYQQQGKQAESRDHTLQFQRLEPPR